MRKSPGRPRKADRRLAGQAGERVVRGAGPGRGGRRRPRAKLAELEAQRDAVAGLLNRADEVARRLCVDGSRPVLYDRKHALESDSLEGETALPVSASLFRPLPDWKR